MKKAFLYISLLISSFGFSQSETVKAEIDTTNIRIGEQFIYKISVDGTENVIIPKLELKNLEVVDSLKMDTIKNKLIKKYVLTGFDSGAFYIPQQQIFVRNQSFLTDSLLINVATVKTDTTKIKKFPIKGIKSEPYQFDDFKKQIYWIVGTLLLIGLLVYYFVFRKKKEETVELVPALPAYEQAIEDLKELDKKLLWQNNRIKEYYSELTDIVRNYLGRDIEIPTLELTSNEIVELVSVQNDTKNLDLSNETISNIDKLLKNADLVKFAKSKPISQEIEYDRKTAEQIINSIKPKVEKYKEVQLAQHPELKDEKPIAHYQNSQSQSKKPESWFTNKENQKKLGFILGFLILFPVGIYFGSKISTFISTISSKYFDGTSTDKLLNSEWKTYTMGNPAVSFESPVNLQKEEMSQELPEEVKQYVVSMDAFNYQSIVNNLQIMVATSVYIPEITADLNGAVNGAIAKMQQTPNLSNLVHQVEGYNENNINGAKITGTFIENTIPKSFEGIIIANKNTIRMLIVSHKENDENGKAISDRIINSIKIKDAE